MKSSLQVCTGNARPSISRTAILVSLAFLCALSPAAAQQLPVTFQDVADSAGITGAWEGTSSLVDINGDGLLDISSGSHLFLNSGSLKFTDVSDTVSLEPGRMAVWADFNNDGHMDFVITHWNGTGPRLFRNEGQLQFTDITGTAGISSSGHGSATWGDYNNDGRVDLLLWRPELKLYRNDGSNTFTDITADVGLDNGWVPDESATFFDYDHDGYQDLLVTNFWNPSRVFHNNGGVSFTDASATTGIQMDVSTGIAVGDYNNDGWLDVFLSCYGGSLGDEGRLFRNEGDGTFTDVTDATGLPLAEDGAIQRNALFQDFNNDGWLDLHETSQGESASQTDRLFLNNADGTFIDWTDSAGIRDSTAGQYAVAGDMDNDGDLDLYVRGPDAGSHFLYESQGVTGNWIVIGLEGVSANRSAIGARVRIVADTLQLIREVCAASGFFAQNSLKLAFGLGDISLIDSVIVQWPDALHSVQTRVDVPVNQYLEILQGHLEAVDDTLLIVAFSPVDLVVTDPWGDSIGIDSATGTIFNTIGLGSSYDTLSDYNGDLDDDDIITIPHPFSGEYSIRIFREDDVPDSAKFTLGIRIDGNQMLEDEEYSDIEVSALGTIVPSTYGWVAAATLPGDVNADGDMTSADIIYTVNYVFKGGMPPVVPGHADVNCDGATASADIIVMVNFVFKGGDPPCSQTAG